MVSPSLTSTPTVPLSPQASHFQAHGEPLFTFERWVTHLEPVAESVTVTATHAPEAPLTPPLSHGFAAFDTHPAATSSVIGSLPLGQSVSSPLLASGPLLTLPFSLPADGTPAMQV